MFNRVVVSTHFPLNDIKYNQYIAILTKHAFALPKEKRKLRINKLKSVITLIQRHLALEGYFMEVKAQTISQPVVGALPSGVTPSVTVRPEAYLAVNPNPVGVNQELLVNMWNQPPLNVARMFVLTNKVTVTKPDGSTDILGLFSSYAG